MSVFWRTSGVPQGSVLSPVLSEGCHQRSAGAANSINNLWRGLDTYPHLPKPEQPADTDDFHQLGHVINLWNITLTWYFSHAPLTCSHQAHTKQTTSCRRERSYYWLYLSSWRRFRLVLLFERNVKNVTQIKESNNLKSNPLKNSSPLTSGELATCIDV